MTHEASKRGGGRGRENLASCISSCHNHVTAPRIPAYAIVQRTALRFCTTEIQPCLSLAVRGDWSEGQPFRGRCPTLRAIYIIYPVTAPVSCFAKIHGQNHAARNAETARKLSSLPYPTLPDPTRPDPTLPYPTLPYPTTPRTAGGSATEKMRVIGIRLLSGLVSERASERDRLKTSRAFQMPMDRSRSKLNTNPSPQSNRHPKPGEARRRFSQSPSSAQRSPPPRAAACVNDSHERVFEKLKDNRASPLLPH